MTDTQNKDKVIDKVRKLLALAGSPNEHEAALAASRAHALLIEHNLTLADVDKREGDEGFVIDKEVVTDSYPWRRNLANAVATLYFCKYYFQTVTKSKTRYDIHCFAGAEHNLAVTKLMFEYLHHTVDRLAQQGVRKSKIPKSEQSSYRTTFRSACTERLLFRIAERISAAKEGKIKGEKGNTLPALASMYDQVGRALEKFLDQNVGKMKIAKNKMALLHPEGLIDGHEAGSEIGLDPQIDRRGTKPQIEFDKSVVTALELEKCDAGFRALLYALDADHKPISVLNIREADDPIDAMEVVCKGFPPPTYAKKGDKLDSGDELSVFEVVMILFEGREI